MNTKDIDNFTEDPAPQYAKDISHCKSVDELLEKLRMEWSELAADAIKIVESMSADDFIYFRKGLRKERKGELAGEDFNDRYADILIPMKMFKVSLAVSQFNAPWGLCFLRLKETGQLNYNKLI